MTLICFAGPAQSPSFKTTKNFIPNTQSARFLYFCTQPRKATKLNYMSNIAIFPGSFDPITIGHVDLIKRALPLYDKIIVAIGVNSQKKYLFSLEERLEWLREVFADEPKVEVGHFSGLTAHYARQIGARYLLRGLRNASDFDYEKTISQLNNIVGEGIETIFLISQPAYSHISSTIVREIIIGGGDATPFVPEALRERFKST